MKAKPPGERYATPDDFGREYRQEFMGEWPHHVQRAYIDKNDWPILVVLASALGETHAAAKKAFKQKTINGKSPELKSLENFLKHILERTLRYRFDLWGLDIPDLPDLIRRIDVDFQANELDTNVRLNIILPSEFRQVMERYRSLGPAMIKDHMTQALAREEEESKKPVIVQSTAGSYPGSALSALGKALTK